MWLPWRIAGPNKPLSQIKENNEQPSSLCEQDDVMMGTGIGPHRRWWLSRV